MLIPKKFVYGFSGLKRKCMGYAFAQTSDAIAQHNCATRAIVNIGRNIFLKPYAFGAHSAPYKIFTATTIES